MFIVWLQADLERLSNRIAITEAFGGKFCVFHFVSVCCRGGDDDPEFFSFFFFAHSLLCAVTGGTDSRPLTARSGQLSGMLWIVCFFAISSFLLHLMRCELIAFVFCRVVFHRLLVVARNLAYFRFARCELLLALELSQ